MSSSLLDSGDTTVLEYLVTHVFFPLRLPDGDDHSISKDRSLVAAVATASHLYSNYASRSGVSQWPSIARMLANLHAVTQSEHLDQSQVTSLFSDMKVGDVVSFLIRAQNAAVIFRKREDVTVFESFEVSPKAHDVMSTQGKLICSYPGPAIEVPNNVFDNRGFLSELANFLVHMNDDILDDAAAKIQDTAHPRYITELLTGIMRSVGHPAEIVRISKRVGDDVVRNNSELPWRRSPLWLLIRVAIQTSLDRSSLGCHAYKEFMLFFMCRLAQEQICAHLSNDLIQCMSSKVSRRLKKLGSSAPDWLSKTVLQTSTSLRSTLNKRWESVQATQRISPSWDPSQLNLARDTQLSLSNSSDYIQNVLTSGSVDSTRTSFKPNHHPRGTLNDFLSLSGKFFETAYSKDPYVTLYDVEQTVEKGIDSWVDHVTNVDKACEKLELLGDKYSSNAVKMYANNPELLSIMLLTMVELWVALDKLAVRETPMLADYSPEVPIYFLEDLLLCKAANLDRLRQVHQYLSRRHSRSRPGWSVFSPPSVDAFAVRFYGESSYLQGLKDQIEKTARNEAREKVAKLEDLNSLHSNLQERIAALDHTWEFDESATQVHVESCETCGLENYLQNIESACIAVYEWPLPSQQSEAKTVVFELACPVFFNMWRTATFHLLVDLSSPSIQSSNPRIQLPDYAALRPYLVRHPRSRITLASNTIVTHHDTVSPPTTEKVCVENGLKYYGFDRRRGIPVSSALGRVDVRKYCTYMLPSGPYQNLQKYVNTTSHTSNEVVASQADCHKDLSIHEFLALGHLRSGGVLQWFNVLRELRSRSPSFRRQEVHLLLAQTASQVGPFDGTKWTWHEVLQDPLFCNALLGELDGLVRNVEANWLEVVTMDTVSFLLRRLLASSPDKAFSVKALELLRTVRCRVFTWVEELSERTLWDEESRGYLRDAAAVCRSTFDIDPALMPSVLRSSEDVDMLFFSSVLIHDQTPSDVDYLSTHSKLLIDRNRRLSLSLEDILRSVIQYDSRDVGIGRAVSRIWSGYRPGSKWSTLRSPNLRWLSCRTAGTATQYSQVLHFNLLEGLFLVDGKPPCKLPNKILWHSTYQLLFGAQILDVMPTDIPDMDYSTRGTISGYQVYFSLRDNDTNLVIRAKQMQGSTNKSEIMELVPREILRGDLPDTLVEDHIHWLNLSTSIMEIRPLCSLWDGSPENWRVTCIFGKYQAHRGHEYLVDIRSRSWDMVSSVLKPLDTPRNLLVSVFLVDSGDGSLQLSVFLPRYSLSFYVDEDRDLQCRSVRGMVYDENQSTGTMFGLANQLVLRPKPRNDNAADLDPRCVLIPEGEILFQKVGHHVSVRVNVNTSGSASYQMYIVDTDLGCLTGSGSLTDKLYCAFLHALTSGCNIDPLTGRSGTEEALSLLKSASCWSIMKLSPRDAELLRLIASISPSRSWYPEHLTSMQKVEWVDLPASSQHHEFFTIARGIKEHYERLQLFQESQNTSSSFSEHFPSQEEHLLQRSARRAASICPFEFTGQPFESNFDAKYIARDQVKGDSREHHAYTAARTVYCRTTNRTNISVLNMAESWKKVSGDTALSLHYSKSWVNPNLPSIWLKTYNLLRRDEEAKWWYMLFSLPALAYSLPNCSDLMPIFVSFASQQEFRLESPPHYDSYDLSRGYSPSWAYLRDRISSRVPRTQVGTAVLDLYSAITIRRLRRAWPCEMPPRSILNLNLYNEEFTRIVKECFSPCYRNIMLRQHLNRVQQILDSVQSQTVPISTRYSFEPSQGDFRIPSGWTLTVDQLFSRVAPPLQSPNRLPRYATEAGTITPSGSTALRQLIAKLPTENAFQNRYISALRVSAECFEKDTSLETHDLAQLPGVKTLVEHYIQCKSNSVKALRHIARHLGPNSDSEKALEQAGQWLHITPHLLLRFLASTSLITLPDNWKKCLVLLALLILELQRSRRLLRLHLESRHEDLRGELQNEGCDGWDADEHPDWLLVQLQGNFFVRRLQAGVADEMISPRSDENNTAMQLNMGEGKSSVIVPIVIVSLADGNQLVRIVVPKALTAQMFQILVDRLGGLTNRRVYYLPFSRSLGVDREKVAGIHALLSECMKERGVLVVQPEHILSLKLVSVEKQLPQGEACGVELPLLGLQSWLHSRSRDILDEIDEILHVRSHLVYAVGHQQDIEGSPERWVIIQQVLRLVHKYASSLGTYFPLGVEYAHGPSGSFPHLRILQQDAGEKLILWILRDIMDGHLPNFGFGQLIPEMRDAVQSFISHHSVSQEIISMVEDYSRQSRLWGGLLLLRGLLATGVLLSALKLRRWRVDYGLAPTRTMLAVPYRAKDIPAQRAEFSHPDIAIILTYLSYYYDGLTEKQLRLSFEILLNRDDPSTDYDHWVQDCTVPESLRTLSGINLKSPEQWEDHLFPLFWRNRATIDFYLSNVVFPKEAKEFPSKLSCSGWDIAEKKARLLTGFSGTNDGQYLLPVHITQRDPDHQRSTNAKVLSYLLQPENDNYQCMTHENGERQASSEFLKVLSEQKPEIRVLLDVGAQMLELDNLQVARTWLDISKHISAAIYFNEDDELTVLTRDGRRQSLLSSPFAQQLDQCVIYLDDAHTRGTNIKFPIEFRAAVTLASNITKDRLVQGCMRMRKLGYGHSIKFFAPLEVDLHIRSIARKGIEDVIDTMDILLWTICQTFADIKYRVADWAQQGKDHSSRYAAWLQFCRKKLSTKELSDKWLQPGAKSLEELYGPQNILQSIGSATETIRQRCMDLGVFVLRDVSADEEQEREMIHEVKQQSERATQYCLVKASPAIHSIHEDVFAFVKTGVVPAGSPAFCPAFKTLATTSAATDEAHIWSSNLLVTVDFQMTITLASKSEDFLRPVQWIASGKTMTGEALVVLSPFEAEHLIPYFRSSDNVRLHLYTPRVAKSMKPCDDLVLYTMPVVLTGWTPPSNLIHQLNVFSGQLYLKDYRTYIRLCRFLCVFAEDLKSELEEIKKVESDGFIAPDCRPRRLKGTHTFQSSPLNSVRALISLRRKDTSFAQTHMGRLLAGQLLLEDDFATDDSEALEILRRPRS